MPTVDEILGPAPGGSRKPSADDVLGKRTPSVGPSLLSDPASVLLNFADALPRSIAADLVATTLEAKKQIGGGGPTGGDWWKATVRDWWKLRERALEVTALPETSVGQAVSEVLDIPGEAVGAVAEAISSKLLGREATEKLSPAVATVADVALATVPGLRLAREGGRPTPPLPPKVPTDINLRAADIVARRLAQDVRYEGPTVIEALEKISKGRALGKPLTLADVGEENVKALRGYVARQPGPSRALANSFLKQRDRAAAERLGQDIRQYISGGPSMLQTTEDLLQARSRSARLLYQSADALQGIWSPRLQEFLKEPRIKRVMARGFELELLDSLAEGRPFDPMQLGVDLDIEGNIVFKKVPNLRVLDMGKRGLDAMIADERSPVDGRLSALGVELNKVRAAYLKEIDSLDSSGVYKAARDAWAGPSQSLDAVRWGRTIFKRFPEENARDFARLSPANQEFVRLGVADILRERIANTSFTGNEARAIIKNPWTRGQLRPVISDDNVDRFFDAVMAEHTMAETIGHTLRGSPTATRLAEDVHGTEIDHPAVSGASHLIHGNFGMALVRGWQVLQRRRLRRELSQNPELSEAVAKILFDPEIDVSDKSIQHMLLEPPPSRTYRAGFAAGKVGRQLGLYGPFFMEPGLFDNYQ